MKIFIAIIIDTSGENVIGAFSSYKKADECIYKYYEEFSYKNLDWRIEEWNLDGGIETYWGYFP